jgi:hypothetical protein
MGTYRRFIGGFVLLFLALSLSLSPAFGQDKEKAEVLGSQRPLSEILNPDGTLKLGQGIEGTFNPQGFKMVAGGEGRPRFVPAVPGQDTVEAGLAAAGDENWDSQFGAISTDSDVYALAVSGTHLYIGGALTTAGRNSINHIAMYDTLTGNWFDFGGGVDGDVYAIAIYGDTIYVGGGFAKAGKDPANNIAMWSQAFRRWYAMGTQNGVNGPVNMIVRSGSDVYVGGWFDHTGDGSQSLNHIAKWSGGSWSSLGEEPNNGVNDVVYGIGVIGTDVYVGGTFTQAGGAAVNCVAKWNGSNWSDLGGGTNGGVYWIAVSGSDVYLGGAFSQAGGITANHIAKLNGTTWSGLGDGVNAEVDEIAVSGTDVYAGGQFTEAGGNPANRIAKWNGISWSPLGIGENNGVNSAVWAIGVIGTDVYVGGYFTEAGGNPANNIAKWDGTSWPASKGTNGDVQAITVSGKDVYVGGIFSWAGGIPVNCIVKWDGASWTSMGGGVTLSYGSYAQVNAIAVSGADVYVGGWFDHAGGGEANGIAKWDGTSWTPLGAGVEHGRVFAIAISGSDVYVGGEFDSVDGNGAANCIAKWDGANWSDLDNGVYDHAFNRNNNVAIVRTIAVRGTDVYVGGNFRKAGTGAYTQANFIARWNGTRWANGEDGYRGVDDEVWAIAVSGTDLYVGGCFYTVLPTSGEGIYTGDLAKWDGTTWTGLGLAWNENGPVKGLAVNGADVYAYGIGSVGGNPVNGIAKWDGANWSALGSGLDSWGYVNHGPIALQGTDVWVGGAFTTAGSKPSDKIGRWFGPLTVISPNGGEIWEAGSVHAITWNTGSGMPSVNLELGSTDGTYWFWSPITSTPTPNTGSFNWTVPNSFGDFYVRVSNAAGGSPSDISDDHFHIVGFRVTSPNGGEQWIAGSTQTITWDTGGDYPTVSIQYSIDNGGTWNDYAYVITNTGSYPWPVPNTPSSQCLIRIRAYPDGAPSDTSDGTFTIAGATRDYEFETKWGSAGSGDGQFNDPHGLAVGSSGSVYVVDTLNHRIQKFTSSGTYLSQWGNNGQGDGQFNAPYGIAIGSSEAVYVADTYNHRIQAFTSSGIFITKWGSVGSGDGQFLNPTAIAIDVESGFVFVADTFNNRVQKFTVNGTFITKWGSEGVADGQFQLPYGIAVDGSGYVYVADTLSQRVQKFTSDGTFVTKWGSTGSGDGQFNHPFGMAVDSAGYVYVVDGDNHRIQKFTSDGTFVTKWGSLGSGDGQFDVPYGIAVDVAWNVYVSELNNDRIQKFQMDLTPTITVTSPNGEEIWEAGSSHNITWTSSGTVGDVRIHYSLDNGVSWNLLVFSTENDGTYPWAIPNEPSSQCRIQVSEQDGVPVDISDGPFTIAGVVPMITVTSPHGGETLQAGSNFNITWTSAGIVGDVAIEYEVGTVWTVVESSTANDGSYSWTVPNTPTTMSRIMVRDVDGQPYDTSPYFSIVTASIRKDDFVGTWDGQGVYYRNSDTAAWVKMASPATKITVGDLDGDGIDDLIGLWPGQGGIWAKYSQSGAWARLSSTAQYICSGDMNGDGRVDLVGTWDGQGVFYRDSITGAWVKLATPATMVTAGDIDNDGTDDLIGLWPSQGGIWVKYSQTGAWARLSSTAVHIAAGDMNGDERDDLLGTWDGQGVFYRDSATGTWVAMATPATLISTGDVDGDAIDDLIGIWPTQGGVWVKYSTDGTWERLSSTAQDITAGKMRAASGGGEALVDGVLAVRPELEGLPFPMGGNEEGPGLSLNRTDFSDRGPGGSRFVYIEDINLAPREEESERLVRVPGPGESGVEWAEQENLFPQEQIRHSKKANRNPCAMPKEIKRKH